MPANEWADSTLLQGKDVRRVIVNGRRTTDLEVTDLVAEAGVAFQNPFDQITGAAITVYDEVAIGPENLGFVAPGFDRPD